MELTELVPALEKDADAAGEQYGVRQGASPYNFAVRGEGTAKAVDGNIVELDVEGVPSDVTVLAADRPRDQRQRAARRERAVRLQRLPQPGRLRGRGHGAQQRGQDDGAQRPRPRRAGRQDGHVPRRVHLPRADGDHDHARAARGERMTAVMEAHGVTKVFGATHALKGVDFAVERGRVTALFGENGAGKSTLMKILAGIEQPTTGELELDGEPVALRLAAGRRRPRRGDHPPGAQPVPEPERRGQPVHGARAGPARRHGRRPRAAGDGDGAAGSGSRSRSTRASTSASCGSASSRSSRSRARWRRTRAC